MEKEMSYTLKILSLAYVAFFFSGTLQPCCPICHPECTIEGYESASVSPSSSVYNALGDFGDLSKEGVTRIREWIDDSLKEMKVDSINVG